MRRRKTAFKIDRKDLNTKISEYIKKGGEIEKVETPEPCEGPGCYKVVDPVLCSSGGSIPRDYPNDYFL